MQTSENTLDVGDLDVGEMEIFGAKVIGMLNGAMAVLMLSIGHRSGLFDTMAELGPCDAAALARRADRDERYIREWLGAMLCAGILDYDPSSGTYRLPAARAALLTRAAGANNMAIFSQMIGVCATVEDQILHCFEHGGGLPYSEFPRFHEVAGEYSAAMHDTNLLQVTLPLVPGILERLESGVALADIGAGRGHAINLMAAAFPRSTFTAIDFSADALAHGEAEAARMGLTNTRFVLQDAATLNEHATYDFITTFDAVHDQADPLAMVRGVHQALAPGGYWLCVDIGASSHEGANADHPLGAFLYTLSCMHCMTVSLAHHGAGLGAMWGEQRALELFNEAGFADISVTKTANDPFNNYYLCRKTV